MSNHSMPDPTLEEQASLIACFKKVNQELKESHPILLSLVLQLSQVCSIAVAQCNKGQLRGKHNNSAEQHLQNAKRLNHTLYAKIARLSDLALIERDTMALYQDSHDLPMLSRGQEELAALLDQIFAFSKYLDMSCATLLDLIYAPPFSSFNKLESKL